MSKKTRRRFDAQLKAKVALEALREAARMADLAAKYCRRRKPSPRPRATASSTHACRVQRATLLIAKLDRLARVCWRSYR
jgi:hypothetical protein